jgi:hypothetical protein
MLVGSLHFSYELMQFYEVVIVSENTIAVYSLVFPDRKDAVEL